MTPLFKKLNFNNQKEILVLNAPDSFEGELTGISSLTSVVQDARKIKNIEFAIIFVTTQDAINKTIDSINTKLLGDVILWYCYPKGTSKKYTCDFNRDNGWSSLGNYNLEGVRMVAIDSDWSAFRFRKTEYIKSLKRQEKHAISTTGKMRANKKIE